MKYTLLIISSLILSALIHSCKNKSQTELPSSLVTKDTVIIKLDTIRERLYINAEEYDSEGNVVKVFGIDPIGIQFLTLNEYRNKKLVQQNQYTFGPRKIKADWFDNNSLSDLGFEESEGKLERIERRKYHSNGENKLIELNQVNYSSNGFQCEAYRFIEEYNTEGKRLNNTTICNNDTIARTRFYKSNEECFYDAWQLMVTQNSTEIDTLTNTGKMNCL